MDYAMFSKAGNYKVAHIVNTAKNLAVSEPIERVWNWVEAELDALSIDPKFEEATDTAVRDAVYDSVVCG